jgi:hypothetical protein
MRHGPGSTLSVVALAVLLSGTIGVSDAAAEEENWVCPPIVTFISTLTYGGDSYDAIGTTWQLNMVTGVVAGVPIGQLLANKPIPQKPYHVLPKVLPPYDKLLWVKKVSGFCYFELGPAGYKGFFAGETCDDCFLTHAVEEVGEDQLYGDEGGSSEEGGEPPPEGEDWCLKYGGTYMQTCYYWVYYDYDSGTEVHRDLSYCGSAWCGEGEQ